MLCIILPLACKAISTFHIRQLRMIFHCGSYAKNRKGVSRRIASTSHLGPRTKVLSLRLLLEASKSASEGSDGKSVASSTMLQKR